MVSRYAEWTSRRCVASDLALCRSGHHFGCSFSASHWVCAKCVCRLFSLRIGLIVKAKRFWARIIRLFYFSSYWIGCVCSNNSVYRSGLDMHKSQGPITHPCLSIIFHAPNCAVPKSFDCRNHQYGRNCLQTQNNDCYSNWLLKQELCAKVWYLLLTGIS